MDLQWGDERFAVVGAFALLQMGPDAGNLSGCRRCAERLADAFGALEAFAQEENGGPLANTYGILGDTSSDDESGDETPPSTPVSLDMPPLSKES